MATYSEASLKYDHSLKPISKKAQTLLRHEPHVRDLMEQYIGQTFMHRLHDPHLYERPWNFDKWLEASDMIRFEYCPHPHGEPQYIRAILGHCGVPRIDPTFFTLLEMSYQWKVHVYHTGSSNNDKPIGAGGLIAGGTSDRRGRQTCFFSASDPLEKSLPDFQELPEDQPRMIHYTHSKRPCCVHL